MPDFFLSNLFYTFMNLKKIKKPSILLFTMLSGLEAAGPLIVSKGARMEIVERIRVDDDHLAQRGDPGIGFVHILEIEQHNI